MKFKYIIIDEDGTPTGTNNEACASAYKTVDYMLVVNLESMEIEFEEKTVAVEEQVFDPKDWS